jgi:SAM-dependent methyltransferase
MNADYNRIIQHYEKCYEKYGDSAKGMDWPDQKDLDTRFRIMTELFESKDRVSLLDFGCGIGLYLQYLIDKGKINRIRYTGLDISGIFIDTCKQKYPEFEFFREDVLKDNTDLKPHDFIVMNGVFTEKRELSFDQMFAYFKVLLHAIFKITKKGIAFNVMSKDVEWEREDLFHLPLSVLSEHMTKELSRNFIIRNDYGLYEYTVYLYK